MQKIAAQLSFYVGLFLMILGSVILLAATAGISRLSALPATLSLLLGAAFAVLAIRLDKKSQYIFLSSLFMQTGLLLLVNVLKLLPVGLDRLWPVFSILAGLSLIPAAVLRKGSSLYSYLVPSFVFIFLGIVLLFFSLGDFPFSFKRFFLNYWPFAALLCGLLLMLLSFVQQHKNREQDT